MAVTTGLKESGNFLTAGIHKAKFLGLELGTVTSQKDGSVYNTMNVKFDIDGHGEWSHNFFEPKSNDRTESQYGPNPSPAEQFMVSLRQIFDALDPKIGESIDNDNVVVNNKKVNLGNLDFNQIVKLAQILTTPCINTEVEIKLIPTNTGFNDFPGFPAKINRAGALGVATRFIGHDLVLSQNEQRKVEAAQNRKPTNVASSNSSLEGLTDIIGIDSTDNTSDLPF